jgi:hypothetical protein
MVRLVMPARPPGFDRAGAWRASGLLDRLPGAGSVLVVTQRDGTE